MFYKQPEFFQIEYHCPDCESITPIVVGIVACIGCGKPLELIAVDAGIDGVVKEEAPKGDPRLN